MNDSRRIRLVTLALIAAGFALLAAAEEAPAADEKPDGDTAQVALEDLEPLPRFERAIKNIRAQVQNAYVSLRYGGQVDPGGLRKSHERVIKNASMSCCVKNVEIITARLETSAEAIRELYAMHQEDRDETALTLVAHMAEHIRGLHAGFQEFRVATAQPPAKRGLDMMTNALLHLSRDLDEYHDCCVAD